MEQYKPKQSEFIDSLKKFIDRIIYSSKVIPSDLKHEISTEIMNLDSFDEIWHDFDTKEGLVDYAVSYSIKQWVDQNLEMASLWKDVATAAANHSDNPSEIANKTLAEFKKEFTINKKDNE
jgi:hypothetical protein